MAPTVLCWVMRATEQLKHLAKLKLSEDAGFRSKPVKQQEEELLADYEVRLEAKLKQTLEDDTRTWCTALLNTVRGQNRQQIGMNALLKGLTLYEEKQRKLRNAEVSEEIRRKAVSGEINGADRIHKLCEVLYHDAKHVQYETTVPLRSGKFSREEQQDLVKAWVSATRERKWTTIAQMTCSRGRFKASIKQKFNSYLLPRLEVYFGTTDGDEIKRELTGQLSQFFDDIDDIDLEIEWSSGVILQLLTNVADEEACLKDGIDGIPSQMLVNLWKDSLMGYAYDVTGASTYKDLLAALEDPKTRSAVVTKFRAPGQEPNLRDRITDPVILQLLTNVADEEACLKDGIDGIPSQMLVNLWKDSLMGYAYDVTGASTYKDLLAALEDPKTRSAVVTKFRAPGQEPNLRDRITDPVILQLLTNVADEQACLMDGIDGIPSQMLSSLWNHSLKKHVRHFAPDAQTKENIRNALKDPDTQQRVLGRYRDMQRKHGSGKTKKPSQRKRSRPSQKPSQRKRSRPSQRDDSDSDNVENATELPKKEVTTRVGRKSKPYHRLY